MASVLVALVAVLPAGAQGNRPPPGHTRALTVVHTSAPIVDGRIDDPVWKVADRASDFWISEYNRKPAEPTEVWVLADDNALYFAFKCTDSKPDAIHAEQRKRDGDFG